MMSVAIPTIWNIARYSGPVRLYSASAMCSPLAKNSLFESRVMRIDAALPTELQQRVLP